jgi:hypothetical protein
VRPAALPASLVALAVIVWAWPVRYISFWSRRNNLGDYHVYLHYGLEMSHGRLPYRDFHIEYPPGAAVIFWFLWQIPGTYVNALSMFNLVCLCICLIGVVQTARALGLSPSRQATAGAVIALSPLLLGPIVFQRFDMSIAAVLAWTVFAAVTERWKLMWALLAIGVLVKLIPIVLIPLLLVWEAHRRGWTAALRDSAVGVAIVAVVAIPLAIVAPAGTWYYLAYNVRRPPQLESLVSNVFLLADKYGHYSLRLVEADHSVGISGAYTSGAALVSSAILVVVVVACALWTRRLLERATVPGDLDLLVSATAATVTAVVVFGKVLSPQYMMWLLPVTLILRGRSGWVAVALTVGAMVTTLAYFPVDYGTLGHLGYMAVRLLTLRNLSLVALLVVCWPRLQAARRWRATPATVEPAAHRPLA